MNKIAVCAAMFALILLAVTACSSAPTPVPPTQPPPPTAVPPAAVQPTSAPTPLPPTVAPTTVPPTIPPTPVPPTAVPPTAVPPTVAPTAVPPTAMPAVAPTTAAPPGLYVSALRLQPSQPTFNANIAFAPTFVNTSGNPMTFRWTVQIWRADTVTKTDGETTTQQTSFAPGTAEYSSPGGYKYGPTGRTCEFFFARVGWFDANNKVSYFTAPAGKMFEQGFSICDVNTVATQIPPTAAPATNIPKPGPGLFVTGLRLQPSDQPQHNVDTTFYPTFVNNTNAVMTFQWRVYIFKADTPNVSNTDTGIQQTSFPVGSGEYQSPGTFKYGSTGNACDAFFARVGWLDQNNKITYFVTPDGKVFEKPFSVCN